MTDKKYQYGSQMPFSGLTLGDQEILLKPGMMLTIPDKYLDEPHVAALLYQGFLVEVVDQEPTDANTEAMTSNHE